VRSVGAIKQSTLLPRLSVLIVLAAHHRNLNPNSRNP